MKNRTVIPSFLNNGFEL